MSGLFTLLSKHKPLIPLFISVSIAVGGAISYTIRLALFNPDVAWRDKHNPGHSNDAYRNKQYKFYSPTIDYSKLEKPPTY